MRIIISGLGVLAMACALAGSAPATIINVPGDQPDIQSAINAAGASGDEIVVASGNYSGTINITSKSLILRGASAASRPVFEITGANDVDGAGSITISAGVIVRGDGINVTIQDMIFVPGGGASFVTSASALKALSSTTITAGATLNLTLSNLLFAPTNGSGAPLLTDPFDDATAIPTTADWPNDVLYMLNRNLVNYINGIGIYNLQDVTIIGAGRDGIVCYTTGGGTFTGSSFTASGVYVSRCARNGTQIGDDNAQNGTITITGTRSRPGMVLRNNNVTTAGSAAATGINAAGTVNIDHLAVLANSSAFSGIGFNLATGLCGPTTVTDSVFAGNTLGIGMPEVGAVTPNVNISRCTFFGNTKGISIGDTSPNYILTDNVFAGAGTGIELLTGAGAKTTLNNNALVTAGANALTVDITGAGAPPLANNSPVTADPQFAATAITSLAALQTAFDVQAAAYATASSTAGPLNGWGDGPVAGIVDWTVLN